ncbi:MAG: nucleotidyltransferase family protein [Alicyclobacillus sp.]|nr:nucleotidyltransferase family protein [Alicyclobacillus sp.]
MNPPSGDCSPRVAALVLAAGRSTRMGQPKQWLSLAGQPMVRWPVATACAAGYDPVVVVTAPTDAARMAEALAGLPVQLCPNPQAESGMASSLCTGLRALPADVAGASVWLADQPLVPAALAQALRTAYLAAAPPALVRARYAGAAGHPVLFDRAYFPALLQATGDTGGRAVLQRHAERIQYVDWPDPVAALDADTPADWRRVQAAWLNRSLANPATTPRTEGG